MKHSVELKLLGRRDENGQYKKYEDAFEFINDHPRFLSKEKIATPVFTISHSKLPRKIKASLEKNKKDKDKLNKENFHLAKRKESNQYVLIHPEDIPSSQESDFEHFLELDEKNAGSVLNKATLEAGKFYIYHEKTESPKKLYLKSPFERLSDDEKDNHTFYEISQDEYNELLKAKKLKALFTPSFFVNTGYSSSSDSLWQFLGLTTADKVNVDPSKGLDDILKNSANVWNIGTSIGYPIAVSTFHGIAHYFTEKSRLKKKYKRGLTAKELYDLKLDSAAFAAKGLIAMGAWELGLFVGQTAISFLTFIPHTAWIPVTLCLCVGLFQGVAAVVAQVLDNKRKGVESSASDLAKIFFTNFLSGALWQACSYIPFGGLLAKTILKPVATFIGNGLVALTTAASTAIVNFMVNKVFPKFYDKVIKPAGTKVKDCFKQSFFGKDNKDQIKNNEHPESIKKNEIFSSNSGPSSPKKI